MEESFTHAAATHLAVSWLLERRHFLACREIANPLGRGIFDAVGVSHPCPETHQLCFTEAYNRVLETDRAEGKRFSPPGSCPPKVKAGQDRYSVVEVKVSRSDLLADLRAGKMVRYATNASHAYLLATEAALLLPDGARRPDHDKALDQLTELGLPPTWGVIVATPTGRETAYLNSIRPARRLRHPEREHLLVQALTISRTVMYRSRQGGY